MKRRQQLTSSLDLSQGTGLNVGANGLLLGHGAIIGDVTISGGTYATGRTPGTQSISNLTFDSAGPSLADQSKFELDLAALSTAGTAGMDWFLVDIDGKLTLNSPMTLELLSRDASGAGLTLAGFDASSRYTWEFMHTSLLDNPNGLSLAQAFVVDATDFLASNPGAAAGAFSVDFNDGDFVIEYNPTAVPEPSSIVLASLASHVLLAPAASAPLSRIPSVRRP